MAIAISGAVIIEDHEGAYTNVITYKQRCDSCGFSPPIPPISVSILPGGNVAHGVYHKESFVCPFCGNHQVVELQG